MLEWAYLPLTENRLGRNDTWYVEDNHNYMCHICAKGVLRFELQSSSY